MHSTAQPGRQLGAPSEMLPVCYPAILEQFSVFLPKKERLWDDNGFPYVISRFAPIVMLAGKMLYWI